MSILLQIKVKSYALNKCLEILTGYLEYPNYSLESRLHNRGEKPLIPQNTYSVILKDLRGIIRWLNKIQFVTKKTLRTLNLVSITSLQWSELYYCVYSMHWKQITLRYLQKEFDELHTTFPDRIIPAWKIAFNCPSNKIYFKII